MSIEDPRNKFISALVENSKARIAKFPGFIVFLGGIVPDVSVVNCEKASLRSFLMSNWTGRGYFDRLWCPEQIKDWASYSVYDDLVEFESDLSHLASVVVLVCESAGSIAELGCFSQIKSIAEKLLVVVHNRYYENESFIKLGVLNFIEGNFGNRVYSYKWDLESGCIKNIAHELGDEIESLISSIPSSAFKSDEPAHQMLFLHGLLVLFQPLTIRELANFLKKLCDEVKESKIKKYLFVLCKLGMVHKRRHAKSEYYYTSYSSGNHRYFEPNISSEDYSFEESRLIVDVANFYKTSDHSRYRALAEYLSEQSK